MIYSKSDLLLFVALYFTFNNNKNVQERGILNSLFIEWRDSHPKKTALRIQEIVNGYSKEYNDLFKKRS